MVSVICLLPHLSKHLPPSLTGYLSVVFSISVLFAEPLESVSLLPYSDLEIMSHDLVLFDTGFRIQGLSTRCPGSLPLTTKLSLCLNIGEPGLTAAGLTFLWTHSELIINLLYKVKEGSTDLEIFLPDRCRGWTLLNSTGIQRELTNLVVKTEPLRGKGEGLFDKGLVF